MSSHRVLRPPRHNGEVCLSDCRVRMFFRVMWFELMQVVAIQSSDEYMKGSVLK